ncbi:EndoU domain-containing protein [Oceanobacillus sp. CFH 90083]|uniref:EndoU domain-containing protein n=1 Tax=Oceanobacillus sp. CFH 90083 TaxID=2592336 RepID=UPI001D134611|nr:EndoU domain-containing protein [Oceanobacillus sp. CFH 90083]
MAKAGILLSEAVSKACQKFPNQYLATVDSGDLHSAELEAQIQRIENRILHLEELQDMVEATDISGVFKNASSWVNDRVMENLMDSKRYLEEKLHRLIDFHQRSPQFFSEIKELEGIVNCGVQQAETSWSAASGRFNIPPVNDLAWTKGIEAKWETREETILQEKLEAEEAHHIQMIEELSAYDLRLWKSGSTDRWFIEKNGDRVFDDELQAYLKRYGDAFDENLYIEVDLEYLLEKDVEAHKKGKSYLADIEYEGKDKVIAQSGAHVTTFQRSSLAAFTGLGLTRRSSNKNHSQDASKKNQDRKNTSEDASVAAKNNGLDSDGKFADPLVEGKYRTYVSIKESRGETPKSRLEWKRTGEYERKVTRIDNLQNTDNFRKGSLGHIFEGELNRKGQAVGFHSESTPNSSGRVVSGTESEINKYGVYEANVEINGIPKVGNSGKSSFFPKEWDAQIIVDEINHAFSNKILIRGNTYVGRASNGMEITMYIDKNNQIISAFPTYP